MESSSKNPKTKTRKSNATAPSSHIHYETHQSLNPETVQQDIQQSNAQDLGRSSNTIQSSNESNRRSLGADRALIDAILELERQDEIQATLISNYIEHLKRLVAQLETVMHSERSSHAKILLYRHILPDTDWVDIITDQRIQTWQDEATACAKLFEKL